MYSFALSSEQKRLIAAFREFGESVFLPERVFQWKRDQGLPDEVVKGFTDLYFSFESSTVGKSFAHSVMSQTLILEELFTLCWSNPAVSERSLQSSDHELVR